MRTRPGRASSCDADTIVLSAPVVSFPHANGFPAPRSEHSDSATSFSSRRVSSLPAHPRSMTRCAALQSRSSLSEASLITIKLCWCGVCVCVCVCGGGGACVLMPKQE